MSLAPRLITLAALASLHIAATRPATRPTPTVALAFSHDGALLFAARHDALLVLSVRDGSLQRTLKPELQRLTSLSLSPDGRFLAVAGGTPGVSGQVLLLDLKTDRVLAKAGGLEDLVTAVYFASDGNSLAAASADRTARVFSVVGDPARLDPAARLEGHTAPVLSILFSTDGKTVVTASADRSIKVWDAGAARLRRTLTNHTAAVQCLALRAGGSHDLPFTCASAGEDRTVRVWQPEIGRMLRIVRGHDAPVLALTYAPDGSSLFSAAADGVVRQIGPDSDRILRHWKASEDWIYAVAVSPDGKHLAAGDWSGAIRLWKLDAAEVRLAW